MAINVGVICTGKQQRRLLRRHTIQNHIDITVYIGILSCSYHLIKLQVTITFGIRRRFGSTYNIALLITTAIDFMDITTL